jgi:SMI1/KNR4 family protein SUKH-1
MTTSWIPMTETGPRVTADDVRRFEHELGHELPEDYRRFLVDVNGGQPSLERAVFRLRTERSILNNLLSLNDPDEGNDLIATQRHSGYPRTEIPKDALTIGYDAGDPAHEEVEISAKEPASLDDAIADADRAVQRGELIRAEAVLNTDVAVS